MAKKQQEQTIFSRFDLRKIGVILVIGVLYSIFVFATINAVYPQPEYNDYCKYTDFAKPMRVAGDEKCPEFKGASDEEIAQCVDQEGYIAYKYDEYGCAKSYYCEFCQRDFDKENEKHNFVSFIISAIFALIAIGVGLHLPAKKGSLNEWVGTGFMLGGLITLFAGTIMVYGELHRYVKPIVIFAELVIVLWLAYRKLGNK
jgi:predicted nucleic acid-binding Zn ribbon protein